MRAILYQIRPFDLHSSLLLRWNTCIDRKCHDSLQPRFILQEPQDMYQAWSQFNPETFHATMPFCKNSKQRFWAHHSYFTQNSSFHRIEASKLATTSLRRVSFVGSIFLWAFFSFSSFSLDRKFWLYSLFSYSKSIPSRAKFCYFEVVHQLQHL